MKQSDTSKKTNTHQLEHVIIGTAGHIDHGKTSLVRALTGIDTDRLPEEKQRGLTIDLGFAYLDLNSGRRVSIVDVPGHEKFVKNMLAGATSINLVLFVIAADDGIMPQTLEHMEIINILGIRHGLVALTKKDLVTDEWLAVVQEDIKKMLSGTSLENAPVIPVSVITGEGIDTCKKTIQKLIDQIETQKSIRVFRMSLDRSFTMSGYGCVVTGPILGGQVSVEDEIELLPVKRILRVRGIEVTGESVPTACAGQRAAINLSNIKSTEIKRGYELSVPGYLQPTNLVDALLRLIKNAKNPLKNRTRIRFHINTSEIMGRVILLDREELKPGEEALVQIILEGLVTTERGDRFIIRSYSPAYTIGGGKVLRYGTERLKRFKEETVKSLSIFARGSLSDIVEYFYWEDGKKTLTVGDVSRLANVHSSVAEKVVGGLISKGVLLSFSLDGKNVIFHRNKIASFKEEILRILKGFHKENPMKMGMEESQLKTALGKDINPQLVAASLSFLKNEKAIKTEDNKVSLMGFNIVASTEDKSAADKVEECFMKAGLAPPSLEEVSAKYGASVGTIITLLVGQKRLVEIEKGLYFPAITLNKLKEVIREQIKKNGPLSVAQFRDLTKTTRKYAVPLLEYFDAVHFTRRTGDVRILL